MELRACPEESCPSPAAVVERFVLESTDGPVEHVGTVCVTGHRFRLPAFLLDAA